MVNVSTIRDKVMYRFPSTKLYKLKQKSRYPKSIIFIEMRIKDAYRIVLKIITANASIDEATRFERIIVFLL